MYYREFQFETGRRQMLPLRNYWQEALQESGVQEGIMVFFCPHTTAGLTINEKADPDVPRDLIYGMGEISPNRQEYQHMEGNSPAHLASLLTGASITVPIVAGKPVLGTWQEIFFCEYDGPRHRRFSVTILEG